MAVDCTTHSTSVNESHISLNNISMVPSYLLSLLCLTSSALLLLFPPSSVRFSCLCASLNVTCSQTNTTCTHFINFPAPSMNRFVYFTDLSAIPPRSGGSSSNPLQGNVVTTSSPVGGSESTLRKDGLFIDYHY